MTWETAREGGELATKAWLANDTGEYGTDGATDDYYGLVERVVAASGVAGPALPDAAAQWRQLRYPAPETLTVPDGSTLHCDAPFPIETLVPGTLTPVEVTDLCWPVKQTMMLTAVKVSQNREGEKVGVSYAPITGQEGFLMHAGDHPKDYPRWMRWVETKIRESTRGCGRSVRAWSRPGPLTAPWTTTWPQLTRTRST